MNKEDLGLMTEFWMRETNNANDMIDAMIKSAQDHSYAIGWRRGAEDLKQIRNQRDELYNSLIAASNYIDSLGGISKSYRASAANAKQ